MVRRRVHRVDQYPFDASTYMVNVTLGSGVYTNIMDAICELLACSYSKGRWSLLHVRYVLGDGVTNRMVLDRLRLRFQGNVRSLWVIEESKQEDSVYHYHIALLINERDVSMSRVRYSLWEMHKDGLLYSYRRIHPDVSKVPAELKRSISMRELKPCATHRGLMLKNESALRYGIYWMSYLAKENTKPNGSQRNFGRTKLPANWRESVQKELPFDAP